MTLEQISSLTSTLGVSLLIWPAWHAAKYARKLHLLNSIGPLDQHGRDKDTYNKLVDGLRRLQASWTTSMNAVFIIGTFLTLASQALETYGAFVSK